jgi:branched-chain amino acid transport system substrate-binding protein
MRKPILAGIAVGALAVALVGCNGQAGSDGGDADGAQTVTIGFIAPLQGAFGEIGANMLAGMQIAVDEVNDNGGLADGSIRLAVESRDEQSSPQTATQAARDFISEDVLLLAGLFSTADCGGVAPVIEESPAVFIQSTCAGNALTGVYTDEAPFERTFGIAGRDSINASALGGVIAERFPEVTDYSVFGFDYAWGHETWEEYRAALEGDDVAVQVAQEQWVPLGDTNYRSQVSALSRGLGGDPAAQGLFLSTFGAGTAAFVQQSEAFDLAAQVGLIANAGEYYAVARSLDGRAPDVWNAYDYNWAAFDTASNTTLVEGYAAMADGAKPVGWTYQGYLAGLAYAAAIEQAGSGDPDAVRDALEGLTFEGPSGEVTINADTHQAEIPVVISHTVGSDSEPDGVEVLETVVVPFGEVER